MSDQPNNPPVGEPSNPGGSGGENGSGGESGGKKDFVSYETHRRLLDEKKRIQERLDALEADKKARETKELEAKGEYQKLLDQEKAERTRLQTELDQTRAEERDRRKLAAVLKASGGSIDSKFYGLVPYGDVVINPDTGEIDAMSVTKAVEKLKAEYPEIIKKPGGPGLPNNAPGTGGTGGTPGTITYGDWVKLPSKDQKKWKREQITD